MKKLFAALLVGAGVLAVSGQAVLANDWSKVRIGVEGAYPPFSEMTPDGQLIGFDIDIADALCEAIQAECTLVPQDWDGIIPALLEGKYDAIIASMSITEERKKSVDFTNRYYQTPAKFVRAKGADIDENSLAGKRIGVQRATTHDSYLSDNYGDDVEIVRYAAQDEANLDMIAGRIDALLADSVALSDGFLATDDGAGFEFFGPDLSDPKWFGEGAGIALRQDDDDLREKFNAAIEQIRSDGTYKAIQDKYFDFDVYGN